MAGHLRDKKLDAATIGPPGWGCGSRRDAVLILLVLIRAQDLFVDDPDDVVVVGCTRIEVSEIVMLHICDISWLCRARLLCDTDSLLCHRVPLQS
jgi:hypothetical protein